MSKFQSRIISMVLSILMFVAMFAGVISAPADAAGETVVPAGTTVYDFTKLTEKTLAPGTAGFEGFSGTVTAAASSSKSYVQITKTSADLLTFTVEGKWSAEFSSTHGNNAKGLLIKAPDGTIYGTANKTALSLSNMPAGTYTILPAAVTTDANDGTGKTVSVSANHAYLSSASFTVESSIPPTDVTNLTAVEGDGQIELNWDASRLATSYEIYVDGNAESIETSATNYTINELANNVVHTFIVKAVNSAGSSAGVTITATPKEPTEPPSAFSLSATAGNKRVNLTWTSAQFAASYDIYRDGAVIASNLTDTFYEDKELINGSDYSYCVAAKNKNGSTRSNTITIQPVEPLPSEINILQQYGLLESAVVKWFNTADVEKYNAYIKKTSDNEYTKIDNKLIRYYGSYYRLDAAGLAAGKYTVKIASVTDGTETNAIETDPISVLAHNRDGYAHDPASPNKTGSGGYNDDGSPKDGAAILYIDKNNINTIELDVVTNNKGGTTHEVGLANIMAGREKGYDKSPLILRFIGLINKADVGGLNGSGYIQIKGCYNITLEGIGSDTMLNGWSWLVRNANNIEIRNFGIKAFYDDGISLDTDNTNIWVHNNDIFYGQNKGGDQQKGDGSLDVKGNSTYVTVSYNHFWDSGKSSLCGMHQDTGTGEFFVTYHHNWFDHSDSRHPRIRVGTIHIYNNYFDGNSKYGVGVTTGGNAFVEANYFRNCYHPVLSSKQGTDALGDGTFSGEDGGMIKMFNNTITGDHTVAVVDARNPITTGFDAYIASERGEIVPSEYKTVQGGTTYNNFDTAANMYAYTPDPPSLVPSLVTSYAGRSDGGDFQYAFDNSAADSSYAIDPVLEAQLGAYTSSIVQNYISGAGTYPSTGGGSVPTEKPQPDINEYDYEIASSVLNGASLDVQINYTGEQTAKEAKLFAVAYTEYGYIAAVKIINVSGSGKYTMPEFSKPANGKIKLFLWDNETSMTPMSKSKEI